MKPPTYLEDFHGRLNNKKTVFNNTDILSPHVQIFCGNLVLLLFFAMNLMYWKMVSFSMFLNLRLLDFSTLALSLCILCTFNIFLPHLKHVFQIRKKTNHKKYDMPCIYYMIYEVKKYDGRNIKKNSTTSLDDVAVVCHSSFRREYFFKD